MLRAELGAEPFKLEREDFPLRISVISASASVRGADGPTPAPVPAPSLYFSFYTDEIDEQMRQLMWCGFRPL